MKNKKRVIAIDYFRGACMLAVVINHASLFNNPLTYLAGAGRLWTGAAEMFFLLSGITFTLVRGKLAHSDFRQVLSKSWRRAAQLYVLNFLVILASLTLAFWLGAKGHSYNMPGSLPSGSFGQLMVGVLSLQYGFGWASFLMYYSIFLLLAPFALKLLYSRLWLVVPLISAGLFAANFFHPLASTYYFFFVWQIYFFLGMSLSRWRKLALNWYRALAKYPRRGLNAAILICAGATAILGGLLAFKPGVVAARIPHFGWFLAHQAGFNHYFQASRTGLLRPLAALLVLASAYIIYKKYEKFLLAKTGKLVNSIGRASLTVFTAQAIAIPVVSALPMTHRSPVLNTLVTAGLCCLMYYVAQYARLVHHINKSIASLATSLMNWSYLSASAVKTILAKFASSPEID
ncbi:MAG TPA: OpgC domain-containing protein [Candidatus Saccharimonadales bacterium]|nr:OpgC domain-containing protein [Candidatus Saccharimonadales bacterium]